MVNNLVRSQAEEIYKEKEENRKRIEEEKSTYKKTLKPLFMQPDRPYFVSFLYPAKYSVDIYVHIVAVYNQQFKKLEYKHSICNKTYAKVDPIYEDCPLCEKVDDKGKKNRPTFYKVFVGYVHNFEGEVFKPEGKDVAYPINPLRLIEIRAGKSKSIHLDLMEHIRRGKFNKCIFEFKKTGKGTDTVYLSPSPINRDEEWIQDEINPQVPEEIVKEWQNKSEDEIFQAILSFYENVKYDLWGIEPPTSLDSEEDDDSDEDESSRVQARKVLD